ncbi:MAG: twin-arginine translocase TatA/TatE family subunit [Chloroflexi bacterium]|nr:twin-arginine translocase TatA/TatE family subunit [Chloroflexota bacterium]
MFGLQPLHIVIILVVALLIFGPSRLPELGKSIGKGINEFRKASSDATDGLKKELDKGAEADKKESESA